MELAVGVVVGLVAAGLVALLVRAAFAGGGPATAPRRPAPPRGRTSIVLDAPRARPDDPAVQRLVRELATRTLASTPTVDVVEVVRPDGEVLGVVERHPPTTPPTALPEELSEPRLPRRHGPDPTRPRGGDERPAVVVDDTPLELPPDRPFADRFDLPAPVRARIADPTDPLDVVRAICSAAGLPAVLDRDLLTVGDTAVVVVGDPRGGAVTARALNHAFLRYQQSGARTGIVLCLGFVRPDHVRRRELLAPTVRHAGPDAVQRMADAVALGVDPFTFALPPAER